MLQRLLLSALAHPLFAYAATKTLDWNITYTRANPDGLFERQVVGVNGQWPIPPIELYYGDRLILNVHNQLDDAQTSLHGHGLFQNGTNFYDGPVGVTQCGIPPGASLTYNFTVAQNGTYWIHSHAYGQYPDGLRTPFIIYNPNEPYQYDEDIIISLSDWYHDPISVLLPQFINKDNPTGAEPIPKAALMGDSQNSTYTFELGKTYRLRFVNIGAFSLFRVWIEGHEMQVIELDGVYTEQPYMVPMLSVSVAQRVSVLVKALNTTDQNFPIVGAMDTTMDDVVPPDLNPNVTSWIVYNESNLNPEPAIINAWDDFDDIDMYPLLPEGVVPPDDLITLGFEFVTLGNGANYAQFNGVSYTSPIIPTLVTVLTAPSELVTNSTIYGTSTSPFILNHNEMIQIVLNNFDTGKHPFHLHGHVFQVLYRSDENEGPYNESMDLTFADNPLRRDTILVNPGGFIIIRFRADNPGVWFFHCHIEWHLLSGLAVTMIEAPIQMRQTLRFPDVMTQQCLSLGVAAQGNAANHSGSIEDWLDLTGEPSAPPPLPPGFTAKGYGGMAGCVITAVIGLVTIIWYGATDSPAARLNEGDVPVSTLRLGDNLEVIEGEGENLAREERQSMSENPEDR